MQLLQKCTNQPTYQPSYHSTYQPSYQPTYLPTRSLARIILLIPPPSAAAGTNQPTYHLSYQPTNLPTILPTNQPAFCTSTTSQPTNLMHFHYQPT